MFKFQAVLARTQPFLSRSVEKRGDQTRFKCRKMVNYYAIRSTCCTPSSQWQLPPDRAVLFAMSPAETRPFLSFPCVLSQACLGKMIIFYISMAQNPKVAFPYRSSQTRHHSLFSTTQHRTTQTACDQIDFLYRAGPESSVSATRSVFPAVLESNKS
jgi:hypothetical protein